MSSNMLKLNGEETEVLFISSPYYRDSFTINSFQVDDTAITPSESVRNLGVIFDKYFNMSDHITSVCRSANFQLRQLRRIRQYLTQSSCAKLTHAFVTSRLVLLTMAIRYLAVFLNVKYKDFSMFLIQQPVL